ncbi:MAG: hypothetical protein ACLVJH_15120 [Faecalibacterium prausnitzii]
MTLNSIVANFQTFKLARPAGHRHHRVPDLPAAGLRQPHPRRAAGQGRAAWCWPVYLAANVLEHAHRHLAAELAAAGSVLADRWVVLFQPEIRRAHGADGRTDQWRLSLLQHQGTATTITSLKGAWRSAHHRHLRRGRALFPEHRRPVR